MNSVGADLDGNRLAGSGVAAFRLFPLAYATDARAL